MVGGTRLPRLLRTGLCFAALLACRPQTRSPSPATLAPTASVTAAPAVASPPSVTPGSGTAAATAVATVAPAGRARLQILSPQAEATLTLPAEIGYSVSDATVSNTSPVRLVVTDGTVKASADVRAPSGTAVVEGLREGTYDLTFTLERMDGRIVTAAPVTIRRVTLVERGVHGEG